KAAWPQYASHIQSVTEKHTGIWKVTLTEPGTLAQKLGLTITGTDPLTIAGNYHKYDSLKIAGPINGTDVGVIRFMGGRDVNNADVTLAGNLCYLDLYDAHIKAGGADYNQDGSNDRITEDDCIDTYMFWELDALETLILPKSVTKIKNHAFNNCDKLNRVVIGDGTKSIGAKVSHDSPKLEEVILLCNEAPATDENAWPENKTIKLFYVPNAIRDQISGNRAYYTRGDSIASPFEDDALMRVLAEKRIYTMYDLVGLNDVENLIKGSSSVKRFNELAMAIAVKELGDNSLCYCINLEEVTLPYNVKSISARAFHYCTSLKSINVGGDSIPTLARDAFETLPKDFVIYVNVGKEDAYRKAWPQYANHIQGFEQPKEEVKVVTVTEPGTLADALGFTVSMETANDIGRISGNIVSIKGLKVNGPINAKDIAVLRMLGGRDEEDADEVVLARMTYLDLYDATICTDPDSICFNRDGKNDYVENDNEIPEHMFWKLDRLQTVILPKSVTKIDDNAFYDCLNLKTIVIGDSTAYIGNDVFGKCKNLKNILLLGNEKAELDGDAFTDPASDQPYQVEKMYIPKSLYGKYIADKEYTAHTKEFCTNYEEDALFRAYGSHAVMSNDQLKNVTNIDGWFDYHSGVKDLTSLGLTAVDTLKAATLSPLKELQKITLPETIAIVENGAFAANTKLQWADFAQCTNEGVLTRNNIGRLGFNQHTLIYAPKNFTAKGITNVVYGSEGNLQCYRFTISDNADYAVPREFKAAAISYDRRFVKGEMTTLCLPFDMELPAGVNAYTLDDEQGDAVVVVKAYSIEAGKPYFVITDENMTLGTQVETTVTVAPKNMEQMSTANYVMTGTFKALTAEEVNPQYIYIPGENNYLYLGSDRTLLPYRAYVQATKIYMPGIVPIIFSDKEDVLVITDGNYTEFENLEERVVGTLAYTRTLNNTWNALYVPFQIELTEELLANYDVAYINDICSYDWDDNGELDDWEVEIIKIKKLAKLKANHPYLIRPKSDEAANLNISQQYTKLHSTAPDKQLAVICSSAYKLYTVKGLYSKTESSYLDNGNYVYAINKYGEWQKMGLSTPLVPFRVYLTMANKDGSPFSDTAQLIRMRVVGEESEDGTTFIYDVEADEELKGENGKVKAIYDLQGRRVLEP
ncbi:MAG: leucine-rich repeat protein, partial [Bacteroidaceae bacterium]|nr:leucine-rich repeat protein [Bacteroidaceae bacterium]